MNVVRNRIEAERELRKAQKVLKNFEILSRGINAEIARLHSIRLKSARAELEMARQRVSRAKELVRVRIRVIRSPAQTLASLGSLAPAATCGRVIW